MSGESLSGETGVLYRVEAVRRTNPDNPKSIVTNFLLDFYLSMLISVLEPPLVTVETPLSPVETTTNTF